MLPNASHTKLLEGVSVKRLAVRSAFLLSKIRHLADYFRLGKAETEDGMVWLGKGPGNFLILHYV